MDNIHPGLYNEVNEEIRLTWISIIGIILITGVLAFKTIFLDNEYYNGAIFTFITIIVIIIFARYRHIKRLALDKILADAKLLLSTINPEQIMINSYEWGGWYVKIIHTDSSDTMHEQIVRVKLPERCIIIDNPVSAEMYVNDNMNIIRLQDNRIIILANESKEKLINYPLSSPPRNIPFFIRFQIMSLMGGGFFFVTMFIVTFQIIFHSNNIDSFISSIIASLFMLLYMVGILIIGNITLKNLKNAHFGWAIAIDITPKSPKTSSFHVERQVATLHIRDINGNEYYQKVTHNAKLNSWPTFIEIPVLFYPDSKITPQQVNAINAKVDFYNIDNNGNITYNSGGVIVIILAMIMNIMLFYGTFITKW